MLKKLLLLTTGGTVASLDSENGLVPEMNADQLLSYLPNIPTNCTIESVQIMNIDSTNMQPEYWITIATALQQYYNQYDGFIVTHGTDTMAYSAAALSYMLQDVKKPIVITGSQIPISYLKTDAKRNISDSIRFACENRGGVYVVFDGRVIQGTRAIKLRTKSYDAFESINFPYVASVKPTSIQYHFEWQAPSTNELSFYSTLCTDVCLVKLFPGIQPEFFDYMKDNYRGIVIESYGSGGIPFQHRNIMQKLIELAEAGLSIVITTQCLEEGEDMSIYEVGRKLDHPAIIRSKNMNTEAIVPKLMWVLGQTNDPLRAKTLMETPIAYDITL